MNYVRYIHSTEKINDSEIAAAANPIPTIGTSRIPTNSMTKKIIFITNALLPS
jgi:hypothetical protein